MWERAKDNKDCCAVFPRSQYVARPCTLYGGVSSGTYASGSQGERMQVSSQVCDHANSFRQIRNFPSRGTVEDSSMNEVLNAWAAFHAFLEAQPTAALLAVLKRLPLVRLRQQAIVVIMLVNILRSAKSLANRLRLSVELLSFQWSSEARRVRAHSLSFGDAPRQPPESPRRRRSFSMTSCRLPVIEEQEIETERMNHDT